MAWLKSVKLLLGYNIKYEYSFQANTELLLSTITPTDQYPAKCWFSGTQNQINQIKPTLTDPNCIYKFSNHIWKYIMFTVLLYLLSFPSVFYNC